MDHHQELQLFLHLADTLNFGRTSSECHVSPATLTRTVQRLERQAGQRLLDRGPRGVALTEPGRRFRDYANHTLGLWATYRNAGQESGSDAGELTGRVGIFATVTACQSLLPDLLAPFRARHPQVRFDIQTGDAPAAIARLDEGGVDLAVAALPGRLPEQLLSREITRTPVVFVASRTHKELARVAQKDCAHPAPGAFGATGPPHSFWADVPYVLPRRGLAREYADRWFRKRRITPRVDSETDGHEALLTLVALGCGVGVVPKLVYEGSVVRDRLVVLPADPALTEFRIGLCVRRPDLRRPLVSALWSTLAAPPPHRE
ncbi:HTH-type transcriptional activator IlvY [Flindersiella endophytica]